MQWFRINVKVPQIDHFTLVSGRHTLTCLAMSGYHVCNLLFSNRGNGDKILLYVYMESKQGSSRAETFHMSSTWENEFEP